MGGGVAVRDKRQLFTYSYLVRYSPLVSSVRSVSFSMSGELSMICCVRCSMFRMLEYADNVNVSSVMFCVFRVSKMFSLLDIV